MHALSVFSLRNRALTALLTVFLMLGGLYAVSTLKRELIPSISFPVMGVVTSVPGAAAGVVEERVTRPMEGAVLGLRGVDKVTSTSSDSLSTVMVTLAYGEDLSKAQNDAQRAILNLRNLPEGATPQVITGSIADFPIIQMSMAGGADQQDLLAKVRAQVVPAIEGIPGVRSVQVSGVADRVILITVDQAKLAAAKVSPTALMTLLQTNGVAVPAGTVTPLVCRRVVSAAGETLAAASLAWSTVMRTTRSATPLTCTLRTPGMPSIAGTTWARTLAKRSC